MLRCLQQLSLQLHSSCRPSSANACTWSHLQCLTCQRWAQPCLLGWVVVQSCQQLQYPSCLTSTHLGPWQSMRNMTRMGRMDDSLLGWAIDPADIELARHPDGSQWVLGSGSYGRVRPHTSARGPDHSVNQYTPCSCTPSGCHTPKLSDVTHHRGFLVACRLCR